MISMSLDRFRNTKHCHSTKVIASRQDVLRVMKRCSPESLHTAAEQTELSNDAELFVGGPHQ